MERDVTEDEKNEVHEALSAITTAGLEAMNCDDAHHGCIAFVSMHTESFSASHYEIAGREVDVALLLHHLLQRHPSVVMAVLLHGEDAISIIRDQADDLPAAH